MDEKIRVLQENLSYLRRALGFAGYRFADLIGFSRQTYYKYEACEQEMPLPAYYAILYILVVLIDRVKDLYPLYEEVMKYWSWEDGFEAHPEVKMAIDLSAGTHQRELPSTPDRQLQACMAFKQNLANYRMEDKVCLAR